MTIKQIGGVFGRNPEFNDVEVTGALDLPDGVVASFGDNKDFQIVHDGSHTYLTDGGDGNVYFRTNSQFNITATNGAVGLQFNPGVNVLLRHNNVPVFTTTSNGAAVYGNLTMATAGGGIDFSATAGTGTSELFDDYEEGTWTPEFVVTGGSFSAITYNTYTGGVYTKVGRLVTITGYITTNSRTVGTDGDLLITNLPFSPASGLGGLSSRSAVSIGTAENWASSGYPISGRLQTGTPHIYLQKRSAVNGTTSAVQASDTAGTTQDNQLSFSAVYYT